MDAFWISTALVALAEIGDKTQLLAFMLAARYRRPWPIVAGILVATLANHWMAGLLGTWLSSQIGPEALRWILGLGFIAMGLWLLVPDKIDDAQATPRPSHGVFIATVVLFFLAEMGDKTQIATVALAARFDSLVAVVAGTTVGMMLANAPAVWLGERLAGRMPTRAVHAVAAAIFVLLGAWVLWRGL